MTRRTVAFAAFLFAALAARFCSVPASAETPSGAVYVTTLPTGADIWVDGTYVGRAPMLVDALVPGHHALTIARTGWVVQEVDVSVPLGGVALSTTHLVAGPRAFSGSATGSIVLRQVPAGASLQLDGANLDPQTGKPVVLAAGSHHIAVVTPKGRSTRTFTVLPDTSTELVLRADPSASESRSAVVAPADDYVGADAYTIEGQKIVVRSNGHLVVAHFGDTAVRYDGSSVSYDSAPTSIAGKLYLPLALLEKLSDDASKAAH
jgi:hypothetical protein